MSFLRNTQLRKVIRHIDSRKKDKQTVYENFMKNDKEFAEFTWMLLDKLGFVEENVLKFV